jgi:DNA primase
MADDSTYWRAEARFDWARYVIDAGGVRAVHSRPGEYLLECPTCRKPKLAVNVEGRAWRCFTCGDGGRDAASLIAKVEGRMFHEALEAVMTGHQRVIGRIDLIQKRLGERTERPRVEVPNAMVWPEGYHSLAAPPTSPDLVKRWARAVGYCKFRGIEDYVVHEMKLGFCTSGRFRNRLIFPVFDYGGRLVFYQGRAMWPAQAHKRYIKTLSPRLEEGYAGASDVLLNLSYLVARGQPERVLVVEGPVDCAHAWPDAVASFGKQLSARQMQLLVRAGVKEIDLGWDPEEMKTTEKQAAKLTDLFTVRVVTWPPGKDPGDLTKEEIDGHRQQAKLWGSGDRLGKLTNSLK